MPTQLNRQFMPQPDQDSTDGLQSSFSSSVSLTIDENVNFGNMNEISVNRPLKTKSTSFMVDQSKVKTFKINEEILFDGVGGVLTM
jgi:hypothetical protein